MVSSTIPLLPASLFPYAAVLASVLSSELVLALPCRFLVVAGIDLLGLRLGEPVSPSWLPQVQGVPVVLLLPVALPSVSLFPYFLLLLLLAVELVLVPVPALCSGLVLQLLPVCLLSVLLQLVVGLEQAV